MLFYIDKSIEECLHDENVKDGLINLARQRKAGKHLIVAKPQTFEKIINSLNRGSQERRIYEFIFRNYNKQKSYLINLKRRVELVSDNNVIEKRIEEGITIIKLSISYLSNPDVASETCLLLENIRDDKLYKYISQYIISKKKITDIDTKFNILAGSGSGIRDVFKEKIEGKNHLILCIADTDKNNPKGPKGTTINPLLTYYNRIKDTCIGEVFYDEYSEVENLIPVAIYEKKEGITKRDIESFCETAATIKTNSNITYPIEWKQFIFRIHFSNKLNVLRYFDYKNGIQLKKFINKVNNKEYWITVLSDIGLSFNIHNYEPINKLNKEQVIIKGFNDNIFNNVIDDLTTISLEHIEDILDEHLVEIWENIGQVLIDWGCCGRPIRIT